MTYAYLSLGSNRGACRAQLNTAIRKLRRLPAARLSATSPLYLSEPLGCPGRQRSYHNAVCELQTTTAPQRLFIRLRQVEKRIQKKTRRRNQARLIDIDYLAHGRCRSRSAVLTLPHPRLYQRAFVLQPLAALLDASEKQRPFDRTYIAEQLKRCHGQTLWQLS